MKAALAPFALAALIGCPCAEAGSTPVVAVTALPNQLHEAAPCLSAAARYHGVNPWVLKAILKVESNFNPRALNRNTNGSVDVGMGQINSIHFGRLARFGVAPADLMDGCVATYVAAWHLASQLRIHGNTWYGVAAYHSVSPCHNTRYAGLLWNVLTEWRIVPGPRVPVSKVAQCVHSGSRPATSGTSAPQAAAVLAFDEK